MSANLPLTAKRLRKVITYDPTSGAFHWKLSRPGCVAGREAGTVRPDGYRQVEIDRKLYRAARLAVLYVTGKWPASDKVVDHRNGVRDDDRWSNLRVATLAENARNRRPTAASGKLGVYAYSGGRWYASIWLNGKTKHLGVHDDIASAARARAIAERYYYGEFAASASRRPSGENLPSLSAPNKRLQGGLGR